MIDTNLTSGEHTSEKAVVAVDHSGDHESCAHPESPVLHFVGLGFVEQILLLRALFLVSAIRLGLFVLPFRVLQRFAQHGNKEPHSSLSVRQYVWAVRAVSRYVPGATCLTQALAAQVFLSRSGHESRIEIGVKTNAQSQLHAHAWVVAGDQIVIGGSEADRYVPLAAWKSKAVRAGKI